MSREQWEKEWEEKKKCLKNSTPLKSYYFLPFSYRLYWILVYVYFIIKRWAAMFKLVFCFSLKPNLSYYTAPTFQLSWVAVCSYFIFVMKYFLIIIQNINYSSIRHDYPLCCPFLHFSLSNIYVQRKTGTKSAETFNSAFRIYIHV